MKRREFIAGLGGVAAWVLAARAQQRAMPVVAFLNSGSQDSFAPMVAAFRQGLKETGYVDGQNVAVEDRWAGGQYDRLPLMALELVGRQVAVIGANTPGVLAIKRAITTIPIVFSTGSDPVLITHITSFVVLPIRLVDGEVLKLTAHLTHSSGIDLFVETPEFTGVRDLFSCPASG